MIIIVIVKISLLFALILSILILRLCLVQCKMFSKCKIFSSVWWHFKKYFEKYFLVFGCVLENTMENTFSTWCSHFSASKQIYNIKQNQKIHQIWSNWEKKEEREVTGFDLKAAEATRSWWVTCLVVVCSTWVERKRVDRWHGSDSGEISGWAWRRRQRRDQWVGLILAKVGLSSSLSLLALSLFSGVWVYVEGMRTTIWPARMCLGITSGGVCLSSLSLSLSSGCFPKIHWR